MKLIKPIGARDKMEYKDSERFYFNRRNYLLNKINDEKRINDKRRGRIYN